MDQSKGVGMPDGPDWLVPPGVPPGTTVELTTVIKAGGLTPEVFELLGQLARDAEAAARSDEVAGPSCPNLTHCHIFHDHGQTCPVLESCNVNTAIVRPPEVLPE